MCKHVLLALRRRALSIGMVVVDGRRHIRVATASVRLRISGTAAREGAHACALVCCCLGLSRMSALLLTVRACRAAYLRAGGITWEVASADGTPVPVPWEQAGGTSALAVLSSLLG
jgi:hypothetical protein